MGKWRAWIGRLSAYAPEWAASVQQYLMFCATCGSRVRPGDNFCSKCGRPALLRRGAIRCPSCTSYIPADSVFCQECGRQVARVPSSLPPVPQFEEPPARPEAIEQEARPLPVAEEADRVPPHERDTVPRSVRIFMAPVARTQEVVPEPTGPITLEPHPEPAPSPLPTPALEPVPIPVEEDWHESPAEPTLPIEPEPIPESEAAVEGMREAASGPVPQSGSEELFAPEPTPSPLDEREDDRVPPPPDEQQPTLSPEPSPEETRRPEDESEVRPAAELPQLDPVEQLLLSAREALAAGALGEAEKRLTRALQESKDSLRSRSILNLLAETALRRGSPAKARDFAQRASAVHAPEQEDLELAASYKLRAAASELLGDLEQAAMMYRRALALNEQLAPEAASVIHLNQSLAALSLTQKKPREAERFAARAIALAEAAASGGPELTGSLELLILALKAQRRSRDSESHLTRLLGIHQEMFGPDSAPAGRNLYELGLVLTEQRRFKEAEDRFGEAARILSVALGPAHKETRRAIGSLLALMRDAGRHQEANELEQRYAEWQKRGVRP